METSIHITPYNFLVKFLKNCSENSPQWRCYEENKPALDHFLDTVNDTSTNVLIVFTIACIINNFVCYNIFDHPELKSRSIPVVMRMKYMANVLSGLLLAIVRIFMLRYGSRAKSLSFRSTCYIITFGAYSFFTIAVWAEFFATLLRYLRAVYPDRTAEPFKTTRPAYVVITCTVMISISFNSNIPISSNVELCKEEERAYCILTKDKGIVGIVYFVLVYMFPLTVTLILMSLLALFKHRRHRELQKLHDPIFNRMFVFSSASTTLFLMTNLPMAVYQIFHFSFQHLWDNCGNIKLLMILFEVAFHFRLVTFNMDWLAFLLYSSLFRFQTVYLFRSLRSKIVCPWNSPSSEHSPTS